MNTLDPIYTLGPSEYQHHMFYRERRIISIFLFKNWLT